jgi:two-component system, chemotaxis family, sensor kinase CheA
VSENDTLTGREIDDLVFAPGLSTATAVTDISGRGVGMDIVRHNSEELGGTCMLQSEPGRGTTFSLEFALDPAVVGRAPGLRSGTTEPRTSDTPRR